MKYITILLIINSILYSGCAHKDSKLSEEKEPEKQTSYTNKEIFRDGKTFEEFKRECLYHFHYLDSIAATTDPSSKEIDFSTSAKFMEIETGINSPADGTSFGKGWFTRKNLRDWHKWFDSCSISESIKNKDSK